MNKSKNRKRNGFSIIELLVVISIIGIIFATSYFAFMGARKSSRDSKRKADLEAYRAALELRKADCGTYPPTLSVNTSAAWTDPCSGSNVTYMSERPTDPLTTSSYQYVYIGGGGTSYTICTALEGKTSPADSRCSGYSCGSGTCTYSVINP